jgi:hypothetical protein
MLTRHATATPSELLPQPNFNCSIHCLCLPLTLHSISIYSIAMLRTQVVKLARATPSARRSFSVAAIRASEGDVGSPRSSMQQGYYSSTHFGTIGEQKLTRYFHVLVTHGRNASKPARPSTSETRKWRRKLPDSNSSPSSVLMSYDNPSQLKFPRLILRPTSLRSLKKRLADQRSHLEELEKHINSLESERRLPTPIIKQRAMD